MLHFAFSASFFLLGVLIQLLSVMLLARGKFWWGVQWEEEHDLENREETDAKRARRLANGYERWGWYSLLGASLLFAPGAISAISAFL